MKEREEARRIYESLLTKKNQIERRRTARHKSFMGLEDESSATLQNEDEQDEHELCEAAQLTASALYGIVCKLSKEADDVREH
jgi:hypothetical protein